MNIKTSACLAAIVALISTFASAAPTITSRQLINSVRVSRTVYDYTYRVTINGDSGDYQNVTAKLTQVGNGTSIVDGNIVVGALGPNASVTPADTITIRQDRTLPFNANSMVWEVNALEQGLIPGDGNESAAALMPDITGQLFVKGSDYSIDSSGAVSLRTGAIIGIRQDATVGEVNTFLKSRGAKIVEAIPGVSAITISFPDVGSVEQLSLFLSDLEADVSVDFALPIQEAIDNTSQPDNGLPDKITGSGDISLIAHQLAVGGAGVWNTRRAPYNTAKNDLITLIYDSFGMGAPANGLFQFQRENPLPFMGFTKSASEPTGHGYVVASIIGARFDMQKTTGLFVPELQFTPRASFIDKYSVNHAPDCLTQTTPATCVPYFETSESTYVDLFAVARALRYYSQLGRVVINISQASLWTQDVASKEKHILLWERLLYDGYGVLSGYVGSPVIAGNIIQVTSACNVVQYKIGPDWKADESSIWNAHALNRRATNALVVEARDVKKKKGRYQPGCRTNNTLLDGNISAIGSGVNGEGVWSLVDQLGTVSNTLKNGASIVGTSLAAPQVTALASLVWQIKPHWTSSQIVSHIKANASDEYKCTFGQAPVISAYETVLALDKNPPSSKKAPDEAPVRNSLFDVNKDGTFEIEDVKLAAKALADGNGKNLYGKGFDQAGSRFDFNADGYLGGEHTAPFNHDMSTDSKGKATLKEDLELPPLPQMPELSSLFNGVTFEDYPGDQSDLYSHFKLDENNATDTDILCYAIASKLFDGDQSKAYDEASKLGLGCYDFAGDVQVIIPDSSAPHDFFVDYPFEAAVATVKGHVIPINSSSQSPSDDECVPPENFVGANGIVLALHLESPPPVNMSLITQIFVNPDNSGCDGFLGIEPQENPGPMAFKLKMYGKSGDQQPFEVDYTQSTGQFKAQISFKGRNGVWTGAPTVSFSTDTLIRKSIIP